MGDDKRLKPTYFCMRMHDEDDQMLEEKSRDLGVSKADVVRLSLRKFCREGDSGSHRPRGDRRERR